MKKLILIAIWALLGGSNSPAIAQLVFFDFNSNPASPAPSKNATAGLPSVQLTGPNVVLAGEAGNPYTDTGGTTHDAGLAGAFSSGVNDGSDEIQFTVNTTGLSAMTLGYDYRSTA